MTTTREQTSLATWTSVCHDPEDWVEIRMIPAERGAGRVESRWLRSADLARADGRTGREYNARGYGIYGGAAPRTSEGGRTAEDVSVVRCVWADIDLEATGEGTAKRKPAATDDDLRGMLEAAGRVWPAPTLAVCSGHGLQLYWRLTVPADPQRASALMARAIPEMGADPAAKDPPRVLRLPGYINTKPDRTETYIVAHDPDAAYSIDDLDAALPAPPPQAPTANPGRRSGTGPSVEERALAYLDATPPAIQGCRGDEATFRVACDLVVGFCLDDDHALQLIAPWNQRCQPPWTEAELRAKLRSARKSGKGQPAYLRDAAPPERAQPPAPPETGGGDGTAPPPPPPLSPEPDLDGPILTNYRTETITVDGKTKTGEVARSLREITVGVSEVLGGRVGRVGGNVFIGRERATRLAEPVAFADKDATLFALLRDAYGAVRWGSGRDDRGDNLVSRQELLAYLQANAAPYLGVSAYPYEPPRREVFVAYQTPEGYAPDGSRLLEFVEFFNPASDRDRGLITAMVITTVWGGPPGQRPLFVVGPAASGLVEQGSGKTELARQVASVVGGTMELSISKGRHLADDIAKQALEEVNLTKRVALLDNMTGVVRDDKLTDLITAKRIHGRASYAKASERANLITWIITTNDLSLSADLASRAAVIRVAPPDRSARPRWQEEVEDYVRRHRHHIIADAIMLLREGERHPISERHTRYPSWDESVLALLPDANEILAHIHQASEATDTDTAELDTFLDTLAEAYQTPVELRTKDLAEVWREAFDDHIDTNVIGRILKRGAERGLLHRSLRKKNRRNGSPWLWSPILYAEHVGIWAGAEDEARGDALPGPSREPSHATETGDYAWR